MRTAGLVGNPNPFGFLMASVGVITLNIMFTTGNKRFLYLSSIAFLLFVIAWVFSGSRAAGLALSLGLTMVLFFHRKKLMQIIKAKMWLMLVIAISILALLFVTPFGVLEIIDTSLLRSVFDDLRYKIWSYYLIEVKEYLWLGRGADEISRFTYKGMSYGPHNLYLEIVLKSGIIGLLAFCLCMLGILRQFYLSMRTGGMISAALLIMLLVYNFFGTSLRGNELS